MKRVVQRIQQVGLPIPLRPMRHLTLGEKVQGGRGRSLEVQEVRTLEDLIGRGLAWCRAATSHLLGRAYRRQRDIFTAGGADRRGVAA